MGVGAACWTVLVEGRDAAANGRRGGFAGRESDVVPDPAELPNMTERLVESPPRRRLRRYCAWRAVATGTVSAGE